MRDRNKYIMIALAALLLVAGYFLLMDNLTEWSYNLEKKKKNAYGTFLTYELLKKKYEKKGFTVIGKSVKESLRQLKKNKTYNYFFLNQNPYYDSITVDTLYKFVNAGNTVFISCEGLSGEMVSLLRRDYHLKLETSYSELFYKFSDSDIEVKKFSTLNFTHPQLRDKKGYPYYMKYKADTAANYFYKFVPIADSERVKPVPSTNSVIFAGEEHSYGTGKNLAILKHGKGQFVILMTALPFTNYFMRKVKGLEYAEKVLAHLPDQPTLWDDVSHKYVPFEGSRDRGDSSFAESPLYFIIKNRELRWAWYLTIAGVLIYAFFHAKRRQNIIPVITPKQNTSLKYVETIGQLYFHEEEHIEIANEMRLQFNNYIRQKYYMKTGDMDDAFLHQLSLKSGIEQDKLEALYAEFKDILKVRSINQQKLHHLNEQLEYFYKNSK